MIEQQLRAVRALLAEPGVWSLGCPAPGRHTLSSAIHAQAKGRDGAMGAHDFMRRFLGGENLHAWNDKPGRTLDEVLAKLDGAIAAAAELELAHA